MNVTEVSREDILSMAGSRILVLGATGFVGTWICQSLAHAADRLAIPLELTILSRSPEPAAAVLQSMAPRLRLRAVSADVTRPLPAVGDHDIVIHAATAASASLNESDPTLMRSTIVDGMRHVLDLAATWGSTKIVFTSSGAVYGRQPEGLDRFDESWTPLDEGSSNAYMEGKRAAEAMLAEWTDGSRRAVAARLFAFLGPGLPLDTHFAAGNFVRDAITGGPIVIRGDGRTIRSYQYPSDMCSWILGLAARQVSEFAYNVGSDTALSLAELASRISKIQTGNPPVEIRGDLQPVHRYVPSTDRIETELGVKNHVGIDESIKKTLGWASN